MNNHSDIWKNITMIIFLILLVFLLLILLLKFKIDVFFEIDGTKSFIKINFLFFEFKRKGSFFLRRKCLKHKTRKKSICRSNTFKEVLKNKRENTLARNLSKNNMSWNKKNVTWKFLSKVIRNIKFEKLEIYEEIGVLGPTMTSYALPIVSTLTVAPLNLLNINYNKFKYKIIPDYKNLKLKIVIDSQISFRLIKIIF